MTKTIVFEDINVLYVIRFNINYDLYKKIKIIINEDIYIFQLEDLILVTIYIKTKRCNPIITNQKYPMN